MVLLFSGVLYAYQDVQCTFIRVIDGDTIVCNIDGWSEIMGQNLPIRMRDCNSPETRTKDISEKTLGLQAKEALAKKLESADTLLLKNISRGKYFRLVADIYLDGEKLTCQGDVFAYAAPSYKCGTKTKCSQMSSCEEAMFYLKQCGVTRLDRDKDGIPCESICN